MRILRLRLALNVSRKQGNICPSQKSISNETTHQEKQFKHILGGRGKWKYPKSGVEFKNLKLEKIKAFLSKKKGN